MKGIESDISIKDIISDQSTIIFSRIFYHYGPSLQQMNLEIRNENITVI